MRKRILCYGDSNTWGYRPDGLGRFDDETRWTGILQKELGKEYRVIEEGYNARTTVFEDPVEHRMSGIDYFYPCVESQSPLDLIIIMLGTNDLKPRFSANAGSIAMALENYAETLKLVPKAGERPKLLLVSPLWIRPEYRKDPGLHYAFGEDADVRSRELAPAIRWIAEETGAYFMDAAEAVSASEEDGLHMNAEGHRALGLALADKVRAILRENRAEN